MTENKAFFIDTESFKAFGYDEKLNEVSFIKKHKRLEQEIYLNMLQENKHKH